MATGALAGRLAVRHRGSSAGPAYRHRVRRLLAAHLRTTAGLARLATLPGVLPAGLRAATADQRVFDDLVEIGLGRGVPTGRMARGLLSAASPLP